MSIVSLICFLIFGLLFVSFFKKDTDIFSPTRLFLLVWSFSIGLTDLKFSKYQPQWTAYSWIILFIPLLSMLLGMFIIYVINFENRIVKVTHIRKSISESSTNSSLLFKSVLILFFAYIISYLATYYVVGYITIFTSKPDIARKDWGIFGFGLFVQSIPSILFLGFLYIITVRKKLIKKLLLSLIIFITFVTYFFLLQRYYLVFSIFISVIFLYYCTKKLRPRNLMIFFTAIMLLFYWISSIRFSRYASNFLFYISKMKFNQKYAIFTEPYMYVVMNIENFVNAATKVTEHTYGLFTFDFIFALTGLKHPLNEYLHLNEFPYMVAGGYNTYTMFFIFYWDFGILGLFIIPCILGSFFSLLYYNMKQRPDLNTISIYCIFVFVIVFSFFVPLITFLHFIFNLSIIFIITKLISSVKIKSLLINE